MMGSVSLIPGSDTLTMTSREIAELTGKRHDNVMRDIRKMLCELYPEVSSDLRTPPAGEYHRGDRSQYKYMSEGTVDAFMAFGTSGRTTASSFEATYTDPQNGQSYQEFRLPKRETLVLIAGYSVPLRARIIDRWQELEAQATDPMRVLSDAAAMRGLLLGYTEKVLALESKVGELAPKAAALDKISAGDEDLTLTQAAKVLDVKVATLTNWMCANGWVYRQNGSWVAYQHQIAKGRLRYKEANYTDANTGAACTRPYCHITPKGLARLAEVFAGQPA